MSDPEVLAERYELGALLGRGGMADVYRATDQLLDRTVAVKVLRDPAADADESARFVAEARTLAGLDHRGLVTLLDAGITSDRPFLVMELVDGPTLSTLIKQRELTSEAVAEHGARVAEALGYVHSRGVLHRDVKPGNVIVGAHDRTKLADFGIARIVGNTARHTRTGEIIGTAAYLAPEQVLGEELTSAVDVYALGLLLLEALTGERAFPGSATEAALARLHRAPDVPDRLSRGWRDLLPAMTDRDPARRPTADAVAVALRDVDGAPTVAMEPPTRRFAPPVLPPATLTPSGAAAVAGGWSLRALRVPLAVAAALLVLVVLAAVARGGSSPARPTRDVAPASSPTSSPAGTPTSSTPTASSTPTPTSRTASAATVSSSPAAPQQHGHAKPHPGKGPGGKGPGGKGPGGKGPRGPKKP